LVNCIRTFGRPASHEELVDAASIASHTSPTLRLDLQAFVFA
jgi:hypothetical protein